MVHYGEEPPTLDSNMNSSLIKVLLLICLSPLAFFASGESIYQQSMLRLNSSNHEKPVKQTLANFQGKPLITAFFMPNCRWCQRQHKALKKLHQHCPNIQTVMLGVQGSKQKLRKALQREKNTFPAYVANNTIIKAIGSKSPVPMMLFFNTQGTLVFKTVGYTPEPKLTALFTQHNINVCSA